jgi:hypothetical protein
VVVVVGAVGGTWLVSSRWRAERDVRVAVAAGLADAPPTDRLMSPDSGAYRYFAGRAGIVTPDDPLPVVEQALRAYDIRWLVLERDHVTEALAPVLTGRERPVWLSEPVLVIPATESDARIASLPDASAPGNDTRRAPRAALYAVCLEPADARCGS